MLIFDMNELYSNESCRKFQIVSLNLQAEKILRDSLIVNNYKEILLERKIMENNNLKKDNDDEDGFKFSNAFTNNYVMEFTRLGLAFEIVIKSFLLSKGFVVHNIDKDINRPLFNKQKIEPITIEEYKIAYDNDFSNLQSTSIAFNIILKPNYVSLLNIDEDMKCFLKMIKDARNVVHFPLDFHANTNLSNDNISCMKRFYNEFIVDYTNKIITDNNFNFRPIKILQ